MKWNDAKAMVNTSWAEEELAPKGQILTKEQYDYVVYYAKNTSIDGRYIESFEDVRGKYVSLGSWFGGGASYFGFSDRPHCSYEPVYKDGKYVGYETYYDPEGEFSYGKYGRIEFVEGIDKS